MIHFLKSISIKLRIAFIVLLSMLCIWTFFLFGYVQFNQVSDLTAKLYNHPVTVAKALSEIELNIVLIHREMKDIALGKELSQASAIVDNLHNETIEKFSILEDRFLGDKQEVQHLKQLFIDWKPIRQKVFNYRLLNRSDLAYGITTNEGAEHIQLLTNAVYEIKQFAENKLEQFYSDTKQETQNSVIVTTILTIIGTVLFVTVSYLVGQSISSQVRKLSKFSQKVSEGDLNAELIPDGNNEIDKLGSDVIAMRDSLKELIYINQTTNKQLLESEKLATLGGLVAGVAHEVNTPLGISITATSVIKEIRNELVTSFQNQELTSTQFEKLMESLTTSSDLLETNLNKGARIIHDFRLTAVDQISDNRCSFNLMEILKALLSSLYPETRKVPVVPVLNGNEELMMNSMPGAVTQVISNLIVNSVRHAFYDETEPEIDISFRSSGNNIILEYRDNGAGIDTSLHKKVFEPFYSTTRSNGLGLNLVQSLVEDRLHGSMSFISSKGQGVHFVFTLPIELPDTKEKTRHVSN